MIVDPIGLHRAVRHETRVQASVAEALRNAGRSPDTTVPTVSLPVKEHPRDRH